MDLEYFLRPSRWVFYAHSLFWLGFLVARVRVLTSGSSDEDDGSDTVQHEAPPVEAPHADALVKLHSFVIVGLYPALWMATTEAVDPPTLGRGVAGLALIGVGAAVASWAIAVFRSYKLHATLERGHELCEDGPFRHIRHPIYLAFGLLGLGSAVWANTPATWGVAGLLWVVADLRARNEEKLLVDAFGERYRSVLGRTKRLLPGLY